MKGQKAINHAPAPAYIERVEPQDVRPEDMTDIGKLTLLFWGYNLVEWTGKVYRKYKFLTTFPEEAQKILEQIYPKYHEYDRRQQEAYQYYSLEREVYKLTGFRIVRTKDLR